MDPENYEEIYYVIDEDQKIQGTICPEDPSFNMYSPRTVSLVIDKIIYPANSKKDVTFVSNRNYENIYDFIYACRISKNIKNPKFAMGNFFNIDEIKKSAKSHYILVSGEKLPEELPKEEKLLIHRYMFYGLIHLNLFEERNLSQEKIVNTEKEALIVSSGQHYFQRNEGWALNTSNLFLGMLIDYYEISSNIYKQDSEISFGNDPNYRKFLYKYLLDVFVKFIQNNSKEKIYDTDTKISNINEKVKIILEEYIK